MINLDFKCTYKITLIKVNNWRIVTEVEEKFFNYIIFIIKN